jgi:hypothetical protein
VSQETTNRSFDDLARALAEGSISRRRALKLFAGSAIAALIPSRALAGGHGKPEECDDPCICHRPPGNPQNAQTLCIPKKAREAHLKNHPLDTCGPCGGTTTSTTSTTSTSTSTTSTSTSTTTPTTSTSTTTACPPGTVEVGNGACARFVGNSGCGGDNCLEAGCLGCIVEVGGGGAAYCRGSGALSPCTNHADCGPGQFCGTGDRTGTGPGACITGC